MMKFGYNRAHGDGRIRPLLIFPIERRCVDRSPATNAFLFIARIRPRVSILAACRRRAAGRRFFLPGRFDGVGGGGRGGRRQGAGAGSFRPPRASALLRAGRRPASPFEPGQTAGSRRGGPFQQPPWGRFSPGRASCLGLSGNRRATRTVLRPVGTTRIRSRRSTERGGPHHREPVSSRRCQIS